MALHIPCDLISWNVPGLHSACHPLHTVLLYALHCLYTPALCPAAICFPSSNLPFSQPGCQGTWEVPQLSPPNFLTPSLPTMCLLLDCCPSFLPYAVLWDWVLRTVVMLLQPSSPTLSFYFLPPHTSPALIMLHMPVTCQPA